MQRSHLGLFPGFSERPRGLLNNLHGPDSWEHPLQSTEWHLEGGHLCCCVPQKTTRTWLPGLIIPILGQQRELLANSMLKLALGFSTPVGNAQ